MLGALQVNSLFKVVRCCESPVKTLTGTSYGIFSRSLLSPTMPRSYTRPLVICSGSFLYLQTPPVAALSSGCGREHLTASGILSSRSSCLCITRGKFTFKKDKSRRKKDSYEEVEDEYDSEDDEDMELESGADFRDIKARVVSLRMDVILKAGLNMPRNKVETAFYASKIRVNGMKRLKKSHQCREGDEIDIIKGPSRQNPDLLNVSRVVIMAHGRIDEDDDKVTVKLRKYPNILVERYEDYKTPEEES